MNDFLDGKPESPTPLATIRAVYEEALLLDAKMRNARKHYPLTSPALDMVQPSVDRLLALTRAALPPQETITPPYRSCCDICVSSPHGGPCEYDGKCDCHRPYVAPEDRT